MSQKPYETAIIEIQSELDRDHAEYQRLYKSIYLEEDSEEKRIYRHKTDMLKSLLKKIELYERK